MIITPVGYLIQAVLYIASDLQNIFQMCVVLSSASMPQSTDIFFTCNGRSLIKRLKEIGPNTESCDTPSFTGSLVEKEPWSKTLLRSIMKI